MRIWKYGTLVLKDLISSSYQAYSGTPELKNQRLGFRLDSFLRPAECGC